MTGLAAGTTGSRMTRSGPQTFGPILLVWMVAGYGDLQLEPLRYRAFTLEVGPSDAFETTAQWNHETASPENPPNR
jgi:hypothetical protein